VTSPGALQAEYFDGLSARAVQVRLQIAAGSLHVDGDGVALRLPLDDVQWPERTRHGARVAHLRGGGSLRGPDAGAWDEWAREAGIAESPVVKAQQSWRGVLVAILVLLLVIAAGYQWGVPWLTRAVLGVVPATVDSTVGAAVLQSLDESLLLPSTASASRQQQLRKAFAAASVRAHPSLEPAAYQLHFRTSRKIGSAPDARTRIGPNAFALPGGTIVVTDEMLELLKGRDDVLLGVLGHELGHVRARHGMRLITQAALIAVAGSLAWGDFSSVFATAPAVLGQSAYSRDFEREADTEAIRLLRANGLSPLVMVEFFERLAAKRAEATAGKADGGFDLGIALASHPADAERIRRFQEAAAR
jgi:Zn-dependent protease with chaperone function